MSPPDDPADLDPPAQLPAIIPPGAVAVAADPVALVPALIAAAGWRYVEFFTANIRNPNTRRAYLTNGGTLEHAQSMAAHESPRTTKLYDRTKERLTQDEIERIVI
jgi:hypothetical protein